MFTCGMATELPTAPSIAPPTVAAVCVDVHHSTECAGNAVTRPASLPTPFCVWLGRGGGEGRPVNGGGTGTGSECASRSGTGLSRDVFRTSHEQLSLPLGGQETSEEKGQEKQQGILGAARGGRSRHKRRQCKETFNERLGQRVNNRGIRGLERPQAHGGRLGIQWGGDHCRRGRARRTGIWC